MTTETDKPLKELSSAQRKAIPHLLANRTVEDAAKAAGVSERTMHRWLADATFAAALMAAEGDLIDFATRRLVRLSDKAIATLEAVLDDDQVSANTKIRAALGILGTLTELRTLRNLEVRLMALERVYFDGTRKP